jgi:hypothetical protein
MPAVPADTYDEITGARRLPKWAKDHGLSTSYVYLLVQQGKLRAIKIGRATVITNRDGAAFLRAQPELKSAS